MGKIIHVLNIRAAVDRSGRKYSDISDAMGMSSNAVSSAIKRYEDRQKEIENRVESAVDKSEKKPQSGGFRLEFLEHLADAIGCDLFDLWETRDENGNIISLYQNDNHSDNNLFTESTESKPKNECEEFQNVEMKNGIVTCPQCGKKIRPYKFF